MGGLSHSTNPRRSRAHDEPWVDGTSIETQLTTRIMEAETWGLEEARPFKISSGDIPNSMRWNLGGTLVEPDLRAAPDHPTAYLG